MTSPPLPGSAATISPSQIATLTTYYPSIATAHYKARLKDPAKVSAAIERDHWRYEQLPAELLKAQNANTGTDASISLDLPNLEKLVQWKITHGHSRPFLPAMIRKNDRSLVKKVTAEGARKLRETLQMSHDVVIANIKDNPDDGITSATAAGQSLYQAIEAFCQLKGIGPATGSLVGSVYAPDQVPFFADESYAWLVEGGQLKLKYDKKEYLALFNAVADLRGRLGGAELGCVDIEKAAFVAMHLDLLGDDKERSKIEQLFERSPLEKAKNRAQDEDEDEDGLQPASVVKPAGKRRPKSVPKPVVEGARRSKRVKRPATYTEMD
ncbi:hypothetical protein DV738_g5658, partial [Chaetothyriales sp. CBS 135597]